MGKDKLARAMTNTTQIYFLQLLPQDPVLETLYRPLSTSHYLCIRC